MRLSPKSPEGQNQRAELCLTDKVLELAKTAAAEFNAPHDLHREDELLRYIMSIKGEETAVSEYFRGGFNSAKQAGRTMAGLPIAEKNPRVLEFASGFGRVSRHLKSAMPSADITASDIHPAACDFIKSKFGLETAPSTSTPEHLSVGDNYDFIFVLSLFSHLPEASFGRWLKALYDRLKPGAFLLITSNGQFTMRRRPEFWGSRFDEKLGYGFAEQSDQLDLDPKEYGSMAVSLTFMGNQISAHLPGGLLYRFTSAAWFGQQDEWIIQRPVALAF